LRRRAGDEHESGDEYEGSAHRADPSKDATEASKVPHEQPAFFTERSSHRFRDHRGGTSFPDCGREHRHPPSSLPAPDQIGRRHGDIYRATDSVLGRVVAIKILADRYVQDESSRERFTREALSAARLSGEPNIVTIFDVGEHDDRPYIVMEYLAAGRSTMCSANGGGNLRARLRLARGSGTCSRCSAP